MARIRRLLVTALRTLFAARVVPAQGLASNSATLRRTREESVPPLFESSLHPHSDLAADQVSFWAVGRTGFQCSPDHELRTYHTTFNTDDYLREDEMRRAAVVMATVIPPDAMSDALVPRAAW